MSYNAAGQVKAINYNDGALYTQYRYYGYQAFVMGDWNDAPPNWGARDFGRLWRIHSYATTPHTVLQDLQYDYDPVGNVTRINDVKNGEDVSFTHDTLDRLIGASGAYTTTYAYDAIGNITNFEGQVYTYTVKPHAVGAAGSNSYGYDANGNMITRSLDGTNYTLVYDAENRLVGVSGGASASFVYDGDGNRVKATFGTTTTIYIADSYEQTGSTVKKYYYAAGQRVAMREDGTLYWLLTDHLGSTAVTADSSGTQVAELRYKPWGEDRYTSGTTPTTFRFTGQREENTIGLYFYRARWYDAALGRFVQADSIVPEPGNPQALNRYSYVLNNPLRYYDPSGHDAEDVIDFLEGFVAQWVYNNAWMSPQAQEALAAKPNEPLPMTVGRHLGNLAAVLQGLAEVVGGTGAAGGGTVICLSGVGCVAGAPVAAGGVTVAAHGGTVAVVAAAQEGQMLGNLLLMAKSFGSQGGRGSNPPTPDEIARVEEHLKQFGPDKPNQAMIERLRSGKWTEYDQRFFEHESVEAQLMARGLSDVEAHLTTLDLQGILYEPGYERYLYHPDVIKMYPEWFNPAAWP